MRSLSLAVLVVATLAGCAPRSAPPPLRTDMKCDACGMNIADLRFAAEREAPGGWRRYDSIECLARDAAAAPGGAIWLPDYDRATLHPAESLWVVKGSFPSPMGGGLAAFLERSTADSIAALTRGRVGRYAELVAGELRP